MKTKQLVLSLFLSVLIAPAVFAGSYKVQANQSSLKWHGSKVTGEHNGTVQIQGGDIQVENGKVTGGTVLADMSTISNEDLSGEWNEKLVGHLKSDDFFSVKDHPTSKLVIKDIKHNSGNNYTVSGDLIIKGISNPVTFDAEMETTDDKVKASGKLTIDRTKYDIRFRSGKFFENLGDKLIHDDFSLEYNIVATK